MKDRLSLNVSDLAYFIIVLGFYLITVIVVYPFLGLTTAMLALFPVILFAWRWGHIAGLISGALALLLNSILFVMIGDHEILILFRNLSGAVGSVVTIVIGWMVGYFHDLSMKLGDELAHRMKLQETVKRQASQLDAVREVGLKLVAELDLEELLYKIILMAVDLLGGVRGALYFYRPQRDELELVVGVGHHANMIGTTLKRGEGLSGRILETREPLIVDDYRAWRGKAGVWREQSGHFAVVGVPVQFGDEFLGVINVASNYPDAYSMESAQLLALFAGNAATAIRNARLYEHAQEEIAVRKQAEQRLEQAKLELERSNSELEQFAYAASHDLQEPLRMVISFLQLLEQELKNEVDEQVDEYIQFAVDGAQRMQRLIEGLLSYSRVSTQARPFHITDCSQVLESALGNLRLAIEERGAQITTEELPAVMADEVQLIQVFQNLINNAIKFQDGSRPVIDIGVAETPLCWQFYVRDNGIGIDPEDTPRLFQMFQRLHSSAEYPGSGIGLAVVKKIVERHGGRIWVESAPGEGSTFYFSLPREVEA